MGPNSDMDLPWHSIFPMAIIWCSHLCGWPWFSSHLWCRGGWWRWHFLFHILQVIVFFFWGSGLMVVQNYVSSTVSGASFGTFNSFSVFWDSWSKFWDKHIVNVVTYVVLSGGSRPLLGDILVIAGTVFYAISNVSEVRELIPLSLFSFSISIFFSILERTLCLRQEWYTDISI